MKSPKIMQKNEDARSCSLILADAPARFTSPRCSPDCPVSRMTPLACAFRLVQMLNFCSAILMSSIGSLVLPPSGVYYPGISHISKEPPWFSAGQDRCILDNIHIVHSLQTILRAFSIPHTFILAGS